MVMEGALTPGGEPTLRHTRRRPAELCTWNPCNSLTSVTPVSLTIKTIKPVQERECCRAGPAAKLGEPVWEERLALSGIHTRRSGQDQGWTVRSEGAIVGRALTRQS